MSLQQEFEVLRRVPFFAEIEPSKLKLLAFMSERAGSSMRPSFPCGASTPTSSAKLRAVEIL